MTQITIKLTRRKISPPRLFSTTRSDSETGAVVTFSGHVRETEGDRKITAIEYSAYESMAHKEIQKIARSAADRWDLFNISIIHRLGTIRVGEASVFIAVESRHRKEAFTACQFLIDELKKTTPIWKEAQSPFAGKESLP